MGKIVYIMPRGGGKTISAIIEFMTDINEQLLIVDRQQRKEEIVKIISNAYPHVNKDLLNKRIVSNPSGLRGFKYKKIILDDHLLWTEADKRNFMYFLPYVAPDLISFTSTKRLYNKMLFYKVKEAKAKGIDSLELTKRESNPIIKKQIISLYQDIITDSDTTIVIKDLVTPRTLGSEEVFHLLKTKTIYQILIEYSFEESFLEEFIETIPWDFYLLLYSVSSEFLSKFGEDLKTFCKLPNHIIKGEFINEYNIKDEQPLILGNLFYEQQV